MTNTLVIVITFCCMPYNECRTRLACMAGSFKQNHPPTSQANPSHPHPVPPPPIQPPGSAPHQKWPDIAGSSYTHVGVNHSSLLVSCRSQPQPGLGRASAGPQPGAADGDCGWNAPGNACRTFLSARWTALYGGQAVCLARDRRCGRYRVSADDGGGGGGGGGGGDRAATVAAEEAAEQACAAAVAAVACTEKDEAASEEACAEEKAEKATRAARVVPDGGGAEVSGREADSEERGRDGAGRRETDRNGEWRKMRWSEGEKQPVVSPSSASVALSNLALSTGGASFSVGRLTQRSIFASSTSCIATSTCKDWNWNVFCPQNGPLNPQPCETIRLEDFLILIFFLTFGVRNSQSIGAALCLTIFSQNPHPWQCPVSNHPIQSYPCLFPVPHCLILSLSRYRKLTKLTTAETTQKVVGIAWCLVVKQRYALDECGLRGRSYSFVTDCGIVLIRCQYLPFSFFLISSPPMSFYEVANRLGWVRFVKIM